MKILYVLSVLGSGMGGHYHSAKIAFTKVSANAHVSVLVIGRVDPPIYSDFDHMFIRFDGTNILSVFHQLKGIPEEYDIYHAYDEYAFFFARVLNWNRKARMILTLCGGPNPDHRYFPKVNNLVCVSRENFTFFNDGKRQKSLTYIPNRVSNFEISRSLIDSLLNEYQISRSLIKILRITRISPYYELSIRQTIALGQALEARGKLNRVIVVGKIYDGRFYETLKSDFPSATFITDDKYTLDAKKLIGLADIIVGTGRSFMEGAMKGKLLFCPNTGSSLPVLATGENIEVLFSRNFSERVNVGTASSDDVEYLVRLLSDENDCLKQYRDWIVEYARANFDAQNLSEKLIQVYRNSDFSPDSKSDFIRHFIRIISVFIRYVWIK